ncbi:MAG TPA: hypothetical protein VFX64_02675 [Candidatus Nitrosotalea sp.]|nr:hypothetical protein [Candidatus Nitrosotalea sp.]
MKNKIIVVSIIVLAFFAGVITSSTLASAETNDKGNPFTFMQKQFDSLRTALTGQSCTIGMVVAGIDSNGHIVCVTVKSPIFFQTFGGEFVFPASTKGPAYVIPLTGIVDSLVVSTNQDPGMGKHLIINILKNGSYTPLRCVLENLVSCTDTSHSFSVNPGDVLEPKVTSNGLIPFELKISAILTH